MMGNLTFTLYEVFGYLLPGGITFLSFVVLYWAFFVSTVPLNIANFQAGLVTWAAITLASYVLGHAVQAVGNLCFHGAENSALGAEHGSAPTWMRDHARQAAIDILNVSPDQRIEPRWVFRALDEYALQTGKEGDREIFVYREGFYRGTALSLFFLSAVLLVRMFLPGASILFTRGLFYVSFWQLLLTAVILSGVAYLFVRRYQRFAEYRVTRAVLSALMIRKALPRRETDKQSDSALE